MNYFLPQVLFQEREWAVSKGSLGEIVQETVDGEAVELEEEEEEEKELFSEKPTPLWATFDPNEVLLDNSCLLAQMRCCWTISVILPK